jgi:hypothetical protein
MSMRRWRLNFPSRSIDILGEDMDPCLSFVIEGPIFERHTRHWTLAMWPCKSY